MRCATEAGALFGLVAGVLALSGDAAAESGSAGWDDPGQAVEAILGEAQVVVAGEGTRDEKADRLLVVASRLCDTRAMGRLAMGPRLSGRPPAEREAFLDLFDRLIVRAYLRRLVLFRDPTFALAPAVIRGDEARVHTVLETAKDTYDVDYTLQRSDAGWRAIDIVVEGLSLNGSYRAQFESFLERRSFEDLLDLMHRRLEAVE